MKQTILQKLENNRGVNRLVMILLLAVVAMLCVIAAPVLSAYRDRAEAASCRLARDTALRSLAPSDPADGAGNGGDLDGICPAGGEIRVVWENGVPSLVCSLHGE